MTETASKIAENRVQRNTQFAIWILFGAAIIYGLVEVIRLSWVCDDAFISFRYAKNLINGLGLVFNAGEHVEGYTNCLWTIVMAGGMLLKVNPVPLSMILGALSYFATIGILALLSWRLFSSSDRPRLYLPVAAFAVLMHHECHVYATSGLETMWTTALVTLGFALLVLGRTPRMPLTAGIVLIAAAMSRPDAMIFYAVSIVYVMATSRTTLRSLALYLLPLILLYFPYWLVRYNYYGYLFPNTYYAKSANLPYYSQGIIYLWLYVKTYYVLFLAVPAVIWLLVRYGKSLIRLPIEENRTRAFLLAVLFCDPYLLYVVRSGGDFMFGRFLILVTPILFLLLELFIHEISPKAKSLLPAALAILLAVLLRWNQFAAAPQIDYVADEPAYYPVAWQQTASEVGGRMREYFIGTGAAIAFRGQYAAYVYYSDVPVAVEATTGLTDTVIAHQSITKRGRPGHEKPAPHSYLVDRKVNFELKTIVAPKTFIDSLCLIRFGELASYIICFSNPLMDHLKQFPEIRFTDIRPLIDTTIGRLPGLSVEEIRPWYEFLKTYYFDHNVDSVRRQPFVEAFKRQKQPVSTGLTAP